MPGRQKKVRIENYLPIIIYCDISEKNDGEDCVIHFTFFAERPKEITGKLKVIYTGQFYELLLRHSVSLEFTNHLGREIAARSEKKDYGWFLSFDYFAKGAN